MYTPERARKTATDHLCQAFLETVSRQPHRIALKGDGGRGEVYTYEEVRRTVLQLAQGLSGPDFCSLQRIGLLSENCPEWPISYLGILASGKTVVPIDANLKLPEIAYIIADAGLSVLMVSPRFEASIGDLLPGLRLVSFDRGSQRSWHSLLREEAPAITRSPDHVAALIYTSGTTGAAKVVTLTHENLLTNLDGVEDALQFDHKDVFLSVLPLHHTYEATCGFLAPLLSGATVVYARSLKSNQILEDIAHNRVSVMTGVPLLFEKMHHNIRRGIQQASVFRRLLFWLLYATSAVGWRLRRKWGKRMFESVRVKAGLSTIRMFVSGGAPLHPDIARFFNYLGIDLLQGYGMTECSPVISTNRPDNIRFGSVGPPIGQIELRIDSPDESGIGEICVRGGSVTPGYLNNPQKTADLIRDGWLFTGDMGRLKEGHLWITGRRKNVIVTAAGKNIYPEELEQRLLESPYILESLVIGRKRDAKQGEEVRALIVPDMEQFRLDFGIQPESPDEDRIRTVIGEVVADLNRRVADFKRIGSFELRIQELEKTSTKKVKRFMYNEPDKS